MLHYGYPVYIAKNVCVAQNRIHVLLQTEILKYPLQFSKDMQISFG